MSETTNAAAEQEHDIVLYHADQGVAHGDEIFEDVVCEPPAEQRDTQDGEEAGAKAVIDVISGGDVAKASR